MRYPVIWSLRCDTMLIKERKYLVLDVRASGHPTTGQNILPFPELTLLDLCPPTPVRGVPALLSTDVMTELDTMLGPDGNPS